jgi:hypothetical protein
MILDTPRCRSDRSTDVNRSTKPGALLAAVRAEVEPFGLTWRRWIEIPLGEWFDDHPASTPETHCSTGQADTR